MSQVKMFCTFYLMFPVIHVQAALQRGIFAKRACVSMEVSARTSGTPTRATVPMDAEARTVNKVSMCVRVVLIDLSLPLSYFTLIHVYRSVHLYKYPSISNLLFFFRLIFSSL